MQKYTDEDLIEAVRDSYSIRQVIIKLGRKPAGGNYKTWMGEPIPLELEHINGNHLDNRLENLTILCPNCHALTPTYRGKNIKRK